MVENNTINFIMGGKLGDFIHSLYAVKGICENKNAKANIYIVDIGWDFGIDNTYLELLPIIIKQTYVKNFTILDKKYYKLDPIQTPQQNTPIQIHVPHLIEQGWVDLGDYIRSPHLYKTAWTNLFSYTFNFPRSIDSWWIQHNNIDSKFSNKVVIHRKNGVRLNENFPYEQIINQYGGDIIFVSSNDIDYTMFPYNKNIPYFKLETICDWFDCINSSALFISNLTGPAAIAHSLDKLRIIELPNTVDAFHCMGEELYSNNIYWFLNHKITNLI